MYQVTSETVGQRIERGSVYGIMLEGENSVLTADDIFNGSSAQTSTSLSDDIELGAVCSAGWRITTFKNGDYLGQKFRLSLYIADLSESGRTTWGDLESYTAGKLSKMTVSQVSRLGEILDGELIPMGEFTCVKAPRTGDGRELYLYDKLYFADKPYAPLINLPALASAVEQDICEQLGIVCAASYSAQGYLYGTNNLDRSQLILTASGQTLFTASFDFTIDSVEAGTTMRQMLGYIAAANGQFGCIDRQGRYVRRWYGESVMTIDRDHADEPVLSETANRIVGIRCVVGDALLTAGEQTGGRVLELENPYMTQSLVNALFQRVKGMSWYTAQIYERLGDPRHDIGDTVTIATEDGDYDIPITNLSYVFDGGLAADIEAVGLTDEEQIQEG